MELETCVVTREREGCEAWNQCLHKWSVERTFPNRVWTQHKSQSCLGQQQSGLPLTSLSPFFVSSSLFTSLSALPFLPKATHVCLSFAFSAHTYTQTHTYTGKGAKHWQSLVASLHQPSFSMHCCFISVSAPFSSQNANACRTLRTLRLHLLSVCECVSVCLCTVCDSGWGCQICSYLCVCLPFECKYECLWVWGHLTIRVCFARVCVCVCVLPAHFIIDYWWGSSVCPCFLLSAVADQSESPRDRRSQSWGEC